MQYNNVTFSPRNLFLAAASERERERELQGFYGIGEEDSSRQETKKTTRTATMTRHSYGGRTEHIHRNLDPDAPATVYQQLFCVLSSFAFSSVTQVCCCFFTLLQLLLLSAISFFSLLLITTFGIRVLLKLAALPCHTYYCCFQQVYMALAGVC